MLPATQYLLSDAFKTSLQFSVPGQIDHNTLDHAQLAHAVKTHGPQAFPAKDLPRIGVRLNKSGNFDAAKIISDHHNAAVNPPKPAPAPAAPAAPARPQIAPYAGVLSPNRKKFVTQFVNEQHPDVRAHVDSHGVHQPGLTARQAYQRAEKAYDTYHAQQMGVPLAEPEPEKIDPQQAQQQSAPVSAAQPQASRAYSNAQTKDGASRFPKVSQIAKGIGLVPSSPMQEPNMAEIFRPAIATAVAERDNEMREAIRRQNSGSPEAKKAAQHDAAIRNGQSVPEKHIDSVMKNLNDHGYYQAANALLYRQNQASHQAQQQPRPQPAPVIQQQPVTKKPLPSPPAMKSPAAAGPPQQSVQQPAATKSPLDLYYRQGHPKRETAIQDWLKTPQGKSALAIRGIDPGDVRRVNQAYDKHFANLASARYQPKVEAEPLPAPKFGYSSHLDHLQPKQPSRFQQLLQAARSGQLKDQLESGLGNFFDRFEHHGNRFLNKLGIDTGDQSFSRSSRLSSIIANLEMLPYEFARKSAPNQLGLFGASDIAAAVAPKSKTRSLRQPAKGQMSLRWAEEDHPRESEAHDNKRPGEFAPKEQHEEKKSPKYVAKGNEIHDENGVRLASFRNEEKAKDAAERWNTEGRPGEKKSDISEKYPSLAGFTEPEPKEEEHATEAGEQPEDDQPEHQDGDAGRETPEASGGDRAERSQKKPKEVADNTSLARHSIDIEKSKIFANGRKRSMFSAPSISVSAMKGANEIWRNQGDPNQVLFNAAQSDPSEWTVKQAEQIKAAKDAGYRFENYCAGKYGTLWVLEKDGRVLTQRGAEALVNGSGRVDIAEQNGRETAKPVVDQLSRFISSLPESTQNNLGALSRAIASSPLGKHVKISRDTNGRLMITDSAKTWRIYEPDSGHDADGNWKSTTPSSLPRFISKLKNMASTDIGEKDGSWANHDRAADAAAFAEHLPKKNATSDIEQQYPSLAGHTESEPEPKKPADEIEQQYPSLKEPMEEANPAESNEPEAFDPEKHGGYKPLLSLAEDIDEGKLTADQYRAKYKFWRDHEKDFTADLSKRFNAQQLKNISGNFGNYSANTNTKEQNAKSVYKSLMISAFHVDSSGMFSYGMEGPMAALDEHVAGVTDETFKKVKAEGEAKAKKNEEADAAVQEGIKNPKTLDDFRNAIKHHGGYRNLPEEHRAAYDDLLASNRRESDSKNKATVSGVSGGTELTGQTSIVEGWHKKHQKPTFTVTIENNLGDHWDGVLNRAKMLGGNYVNGRVARMYGATPGFQFMSKEAAEKFQKAIGGEDVDRSEMMDERRAGKIENASERLSALADVAKQRAEQELNRPRLANTSRRAEMAASAEGAARREIARAETLRKISEGLADGKLKHLTGIRAASHVDALDSALSRAKYMRWRDDSNKKDAPHGSAGRDSYEEMRSRPADAEDIANAQYPYPKMWRSQLHEYLNSFADEPGLKKLSAGLKKAIDNSPFKAKVSGFKVSGGKTLTAGQLDHIRLSEHQGIERMIGDKAIRVHATEDPKLLKGRHQVAYTADGGTTWATTADGAVVSSLRNHFDGGKSKLDLIDAPQDDQVEISNKDYISDLQSVIKKLKRSKNQNLRRAAEHLSMNMEDYNRLQAADIKSPAELRAALREYNPLKTRQDKADPVKEMERSLIGKKIDGFFPTPRPVVDRMLAAADIQPGMSVLEPSAGKGDILDAVKEQHPEAKTTAIEPVHSLRDIITAKGHELHDDSDFLEHKGQYDRIVMNPPFEGRQDVSHVMHAYNENLKPGGRLVAIMGAGSFGGSSKNDREFQQWLEDHDAEIEDMPSGSFAGTDSFRKTGVNTKMVVIDKPRDAAEFSRDLALVLNS